MSDQLDLMRAVPAVAETLKSLQNRMAACRLCPLALSRNQVVPGTGPDNAAVAFVGEAPGYDEDLQGKPFVGASGGLLDKILAAMNLTREQVYTVNVVGCRPPNNRNPEEGETKACEPFFKGQLRLVKPRVIVTLGNTATHALIPGAAGILRLHGMWQTWEGIAVLPTFHPAYILRLGGVELEARKKDMWSDLKKVMKKLEEVQNGG